MSAAPFELWVFLSRSPLLWLTVTLAAYVAADRVSQATGRHPLANPVLHSIWLIGLILWATATPYGTYFEGAQFVHFLLGPATVSLAFPLWEHRKTVLRTAVPMLAALIVGSVVALGSVLLTGALLGLPQELLVAMAPKSVTAAVAMGIATTMGGDPALTAVMVALTGILGAIIVTPLFNLLKVTDWRARGFAVGLASHGIGTARAFQVHPLAGTFAGIAMGLNALLTAILVPLALGLLAR